MGSQVSLIGACGRPHEGQPTLFQDQQLMRVLRELLLMRSQEHARSTLLHQKPKDTFMKDLRTHVSIHGRQLCV
jgi:hypothetical protein